MIEKRFSIKNSNIVQNGYFIRDKENEFSFPTTTDGSDLLMYKKALNKLYNKNKRLEYDIEHQQNFIKELLKKPKMTDVLPQVFEILEANKQLEDDFSQIEKLLNNLNKIEEFWDDSILIEVVQKIAKIIGVELDND